MSKRFEWHSYYKRMVLDTKTNKIIKVIDTLNQQQQRIAELEEQLKNATKQVRKEVCEEVYKKCEPLFRLVNNYDNGDVIERNELVDILEQIQGE